MPEHFSSPTRSRLRFEPLEDRATPASWGLDPTFGGDGISIVPVSTAVDNARSLVQTQDGKFVAAGTASVNDHSEFAVVRYTADGLPDPTFGGAGTVTVPVGDGFTAIATAAAVLPNGKIVVAGECVDGSGEPVLGSIEAVGLVRFNPDGSLDQTFGTGGKVVANLARTHPRVTSLVVQPDGKLIIGGTAYNGADHDFFVARFFADGRLDAGFGTAGQTVTSFSSGDDTGRSLALQSDGKIVLGGSKDNVTDSDFAVARYNPDGALDSTFDGDGRAVFGTGREDFGNAVVVDPGGRIVLAGTTGFPGDYRAALVGFLPDGTPDETFGTGGIGTAPISGGSGYMTGLKRTADGGFVSVGRAGPQAALWRFTSSGSADQTFSEDGVAATHLVAGPASSLADGVVVQPDGRIVMIGDRPDAPKLDFTLARFLADGTLDPTFGGGGGFITTSFASTWAVAQAVARQPDGKLVVTGFTRPTTQDRDIAVARYLPDGRLDPTFGTGGRVVTTFGTGNDQGSAVAVQADGKVLVAARAFTGTHTDFAVIRYNPDGTLDETFGTGGWVTTAFGRNGYPSDMSVQADGRILVVGATDDLTQVDTVFVRYNPDGILDETFDGDGKLLLPLSAADDRVAAATVLPDGRILAVGFLVSGPDVNSLLMRLNADGSPDTIFGEGDGQVITPVAETGLPSTLAVAPDGSFIVGGSLALGPVQRSATVARFTATGDLDPTFGIDGLVTIQIGDASARYLSAVAFDPDGKVVGIGDARVGELTRPAAVRLTATGNLDPTFDGDGKLIAPDAGVDVPITGGVLDPDGKITAVGFGAPGFVDGFAVLRFRSENRPPAVTATTLDLANHAPLTVGGPTYVSDPDGGPVTVTLTAGPAHGTLTLQPDGDFTYTPDLTFLGYDQFLYRVTDADGGYADAAVTFFVSEADGVVVAVRDDPLLAGKKSLFVIGSEAADDILVRPQGTSKTAYTVTVNGGPAEAVAGVTGRIYLTTFDGADVLRLGLVRVPAVIDAGAGDDTVTAGAGADSITGSLGDDVLDGGAGRDRLVETANATIKLISGTATKNGSLTGVGTDVLVRNRIETAALTGGPGANRIDAAAFIGRTTLVGGGGADVMLAGQSPAVLIGGDGDDHLIGGPGRDILIGGTGRDVLLGGAKDDLLIGGVTAHDAVPTALVAIQQEWLSATLYGARIKHLSGTLAGGRNGSTVLTAATVSDDGAAADTLTGGANWEWFFRDTGDVLPDLLMGLETVTDI